MIFQSAGGGTSGDNVPLLLNVSNSSQDGIKYSVDYKKTWKDISDLFLSYEFSTLKDLESLGGGSIYFSIPGTELKVGLGYSMASYLGKKMVILEII